MAKGNWRDDLDRKLLGILKSKGVSAFLETAKALLAVDHKGDPRLKAHFVGEVCECVMWGLTKKYIEITGVEAKLFHSVVLKDLNNPKSEFCTELDFVLLTPSFMLTTECKSYSGDLAIKDKCTLCHRGQEMDVWRQSKLHYDKLVLYAQQLVAPGLGLITVPVFANVFVFSNAEVTDLRNAENRRTISVLTSTGLIDYYDAMFKRYSCPVFDYEHACRILGTCSRSKKLHAQHGSYLGYSD